MKRREFSRDVRVEIMKRARDATGQIRCEACGVAAKRFHIDHTIPDALYIDKSKPLTAADCTLLCAGSRDTCHGRKTAEQDQPTIAKAKRNEAKHLGIEGRPTPLTGRTRDEMNRDRETRRAARGRKEPLAPLALYR